MSCQCCQKKPKGNIKVQFSITFFNKVILSVILTKISNVFNCLELIDKVLLINPRGRWSAPLAGGHYVVS